MNIIDFDVFAAVNDAIAAWPGRIDYAGSLHPEKFAEWFRRRAKGGYPGTPQRWAHKINAKHEMPADHATADWGGSSSLLMVKVLLEQGLTRIVLAGVPMDARPHFPGALNKWSGGAWGDAEDFSKAWETHRDEIGPFVRSASGWTCELLGEPTKEWLCG